MVKYKTVSVKEDVYAELARLAAERGITINDLIAELLASRRRRSELEEIEEGIREIRELLRECLSRVERGRPTETAGGEGEDSLPDFLRGNPWIDVIRVRRQQ